MCGVLYGDAHRSDHVLLVDEFNDAMIAPLAPIIVQSLVQERFHAVGRLRLEREKLPKIVFQRILQKIGEVF